MIKFAPKRTASETPVQQRQDSDEEKIFSVQPVSHSKKERSSSSSSTSSRSRSNSNSSKEDTPTATTSRQQPSTSGVISTATVENSLPIWEDYMPDLKKDLELLLGNYLALPQQQQKNLSAPVDDKQSASESESESEASSDSPSNVMGTKKKQTTHVSKSAKKQKKSSKKPSASATPKKTKKPSKSKTLGAQGKKRIVQLAKKLTKALEDSL